MTDAKPTRTVPELPETRIERTLARLSAGFGTTILFVAAILAGSLLGTAFSAAGEVLGTYVDYTVLALVGLLFFEVRLSAIAHSGTNIRFLSIAWITNFLLVPTIGFAIASLFLSGQPLFFTGLVIYFMAPCTDWFLGFTRLAGGNTSLGTVLLPINMVSQLLLYPLYLHLFTEGVSPVGVTTIGESLLQWFLVTFLIAVVAHEVLSRVVPLQAFARLLAWVGYLIPFVIALLIIEIFAANIAVIIEHTAVFAIMLIAILLFFVATFILGEVVSRLADFAYPEHALLTMTTAARNAPMMLGVTAIAMPDQPLIYAAIVIGMLVEFPHLTALRQILVRGRGTGTAKPTSRRRVLWDAPSSASSDVSASSTDSLMETGESPSVF
ncbi:arsenic resistance protein [Brucella intermedia]|uniref:arsenic resistance protein n=1 Tax=Brucella intermedia TaxID=94625 RepID=UPI0022499640|nr:hypothetical protein [Brucella intermedia]